MSKKEDIKVKCPAYMFNIDFILKNFDIFNDDKENENDFQKSIRFRMLPGVCLDTNEDEYIEQVNCSKPVIKNCMLSLSDEQLKNDLRACVLAYKSKCNNSSESSQIGCFQIENLHCIFNQIKKEFDENFLKNKSNQGSKCPQYGQPTERTISLLAQLKNPSNSKPAGSVYFSLHMTCFGPYKQKQNMSLAEEGHEGFLSEPEYDDKKIKTGVKTTDKDYDEYVAQINENSLIVRVPKENPYLVTQVFDASTDKIKDSLTIRGCNQQIDFQFPNNFTCCQCKQKFGKCNCNPNSSLTEYQRKTSCDGKSYKNGDILPAIRGNLKYPGQFENQSVLFNVQNTSAETTEKYRACPIKSRGVNLQVDDKNLHRVNEGLCPIPQGIQICSKGCDDDTDVFTFKINRKRTAKNGKKNEIELELRTPRGPRAEIPKLETREIQVDENEFIETKKGQVKGKNDAKTKSATKGSMKRK